MSFFNASMYVLNNMVNAENIIPENQAIIIIIASTSSMLMHTKINEKALVSR